MIRMLLEGMLSDIELVLFGQRHGFIERPGFRRHGVADVLEHAFKQHANHRFVLDDKDSPACLRF